MKKFSLLVCLLFISMYASSTVRVTITSPSGTTASSPLKVAAYASSDRVVTGWRVYIDNRDVFSAGSTPSISTSLSSTVGSHVVAVRAWDSSGAYHTAYSTLTVSGTSTTSSSAGPVPPSNAVVYTKIEERSPSSWFSCRSLGCSGSNSPASYWVAPYQGSPSLDGASTKFFVSGSAWADVLWAARLGGSAAAKTHFILDYWVKPNADTLTHAEALEFDVVMVYNGRKWDFSHQFHYGGRHFDTWDGVNLKWVHTSTSMPKLDPTKWHHIKMYGERVGAKTHNISLTIDSTTYQIPSAYAWHDTRATSWSNSIIVQVQIDINGNPGTASEYIDKMSLYLW